MFQSTGLTRYQLSPASGAPLFTPAAMLNIPAVRPPSAFGDRHAYLIWLNTDSFGNVVSLGTIHKADPLTLQPIPGDNPIPLATLSGVSPVLTGDMVRNILIGTYTYTGANSPGAKWREMTFGPAAPSIHQRHPAASCQPHLILAVSFLNNSSSDSIRTPTSLAWDGTNL